MITPTCALSIKLKKKNPKWYSIFVEDKISHFYKMKREIILILLPKAKNSGIDEPLFIHMTE